MRFDQIPSVPIIVLLQVTDMDRGGMKAHIVLEGEATRKSMEETMHPLYLQVKEKG